MAQVELNEMDVKNLLAIINQAQIKGDTAETIVILKQKLTAALPKQPEPAPETPEA